MTVQGKGDSPVRPSGGGRKAGKVPWVQGAALLRKTGIEFISVCKQKELRYEPNPCSGFLIN